MEREFGPIRRRVYTETRPAAEKVPVSIAPPRQKYLIVDGYNMVFAWEHLKELAKEDLDAARRSLCDDLQSYAGYRKIRTVAVFDGYRVKGGRGERENRDDLQVVFTKEGETADRYIEELAATIGKSYDVKVATSDALVQLSSFRSGVLRMSASELWETVAQAKQEMAEYYRT